MNSRSMHTPREVAEALAVSEFTVYRLIKAGRIKAIKVSHQWRIPAEEAERIKREGTDGTAKA